MFLPFIERLKGLSMKLDYSFMSKLKLVGNKTLNPGVMSLFYEPAK